MDHRARILQSVRANMPPAQDHPGKWKPLVSGIDLKDRFAFCLDAIGGQARFFDSRDEALSSLNEIDSAPAVRDLVRGVSSGDPSLEPDITVVESHLAVAENGAVFVTDEAVSERHYLFLGQKLIALVPLDGLVSSMHEAYERIELAKVRFGIFIAGPSATADIAQILVRGAHGPSQMEVWMYGQGL